MKLIVGLGNPGPEFEHTRHNAGFDALDKVAAFFQVTLRKRCFCPYMYAKVPGAILLKPLTYMNNSGKAIKYFKKKFNSEDIIVLVDNMDLAVGGLRIKLGGGTAGQKGLKSIAEVLGNEDFARIFIGTGRPAEGVSVNDHVLSREKDPVKLNAYCEALEAAAMGAKDFISGESIGQIQCKYNRKGIL